MSKVLKHWGLIQQPFRDIPLSSKARDLFSNRKDELVSLTELEEMGLLCLHGPQGVGKTTFYRRFIAEREEHNRNIDYLIIEIIPQKSQILLQILKEVLKAIQAGQLHVKNKRKLKIYQKLERIDEIITISDTINTEIKAPHLLEQLLTGFKVGGENNTSKTFNPITNENAASELKTVLTSLSKKTFILVDNTEKLADFYDKTGDYIAAVSQLSHLLITTFDPEYLTLAISIDERFVLRMRNPNSTKTQFPSHTFSRFFSLEPMDINGSIDLISRRMRDAGWQGGQEELIDEAALNALQNASDGFPRAIVLMMGIALQICVNKGIWRINESIIWDSYDELIKSGQISRRKQRAQTSETDEILIDFLRNHGPRSASDLDLIVAAGLKTAQLGTRLNRLEELGLLESYREGKKRFFHLPDSS